MERAKFIQEWSESEEENFSALCRKYGVSRKTGYKYLSRYEEGGLSGLEDRRRGPREVGTYSSTEVVNALLAVKREHPKWGPKKVHAVVNREQPELEVPSPSTVGKILKRHGLVTPRRRRLRVPVPIRGEGGLKAGAFSNDLWTIDFKGDFKMGNGERVYPLTVMDHASRYLLCCQALPNTKGRGVREAFERLFEEFGLPARLRMDNGAPFVSSQALGGLSRLGVWWTRLGIEIERCDVGRPDQNGAHERMHKTLKAEACQEAGSDLLDQQRRLDLFRGSYNIRRPHEHLGMKTPDQSYALSLRKWPCPEEDPSYPAGFETRKGSMRGGIIVNSQHVYLGAHLSHEVLGLHLRGAGRRDVYFGAIWLARLKREEGEWMVQRTVPEDLKTQSKGLPPPSQEGSTDGAPAGDTATSVDNSSS